MMRLNSLIVGDALTELRQLPTASVDCCVTSPPYFQLRNYRVDGQIGLENTVDEWVEQLRTVCREIRRVLVSTGSLWINVGDSYSRQASYGAPNKSLLLAPERLLLGLLADGLLVRNKAVWSKPNPMPCSARDRLNTTHEYLYFLTSQPDYFFDLDAIRAPHRSRRPSSRPTQVSSVKAPIWSGPLAGNNSGLNHLRASGRVGHPLGKNPGDVWTIATAGSQAHHATFPERLIEIPIKATCPERVCRACGNPWRRQAARALGHLAVIGEIAPSCDCRADWRAGIVLDPFMGSGTTAVVAERLGRRWVGVELNPDFAQSAQARSAAQKAAA